MNISTIKIGGKNRPVRFSYAALYEYEKMTGRNAINDFAVLGGGGMSVVIAADLVFAGLSVGYKSGGANVDFTAYDVADWSFEDPEVITKAMELFSDSFPKQIAEAADKGKKTPRRPGMT